MYSTFRKSIPKSKIGSLKFCLTLGTHVKRSYARYGYLLSLSLLGLCLFEGCNSDDHSTNLAVQVPTLESGFNVRGSFLGVWGEDKPHGQVWFVGGELQEDGSTHSLIANYSPESVTMNPTSIDGKIKLLSESEGGLLWWIWGDEESGTLWAGGENGQILRGSTDLDSTEWVGEDILIRDDLKEKLIIWGIWGRETDRKLEIWAVGGSVRRGGPKGILLKRNPEGVWERIIHSALPIEDETDPLQGRNLYKVWGNDQQIWLVGEGNITLTSHLIKDEQGQNWSTWQVIEPQNQQAELLFTVAGSKETQANPWVVGGYAQGKVFQWQPDTFENILSSETESSPTHLSGSWLELSLPSLPPLNGISLSDELVLAVGAQGSLVAWSPNLDLNKFSDQDIHRQWVKDAEQMTLHSVWFSSQGKAWIVGGDLTSLKSGVIISPQSWNPQQNKISMEQW